MAAAMGGVQTLATSSYDEALGLPSAEAVQLSLKTQQILAYETDAIAAIDPLGGSYYVESLTLDIEQRARALLHDIESRGGAVTAIESGYVQGLIADASYRLQHAIETGERVRVGVNAFVGPAPPEPPSRPMRPSGGLDEARASLAAAREKRDETRTAQALARLADAADRGENTMPAVLAAVRAYASIGEICDVLRARWGIHRDSFSL
jgi:methylmalonyl-CoA mutase N-terminal domain/subunit